MFIKVLSLNIQLELIPVVIQGIIWIGIFNVHGQLLHSVTAPVLYNNESLSRESPNHCEH